MPAFTITDPHTGSTARISPERGFNCFEFRAMVGGQPVDVLDTLPGFEQGEVKATSSGIPILFPFPNRIRAGKFRWKNKEYTLPLNDTKYGNAIHGLCFDRPWRVIEQRDDLITGQFQLSVDAADRMELWPTDFLIEVDYEIVRNRLRANFRIGNPSDRSLPWGLGTHPYFKLPLGATSNVQSCLIEAPASKRWELTNCVPTGKVQDVDESCDLRDGAYPSMMTLDDVYTSVSCDGPQFDCVVLDEKAGLQVTQTCPPIFRELVVFTPPNRSAVCIEPYTCPTDAINLTEGGIECGWRTLGPGSEFHTWIDITAGPVLA